MHESRDAGVTSRAGRGSHKAIDGRCLQDELMGGCGSRGGRGGPDVTGGLRKWGTRPEWSEKSVQDSDRQRAAGT